MYFSSLCTTLSSQKAYNSLPLPSSPSSSSSFSSFYLFFSNPKSEFFFPLLAIFFSIVIFIILQLFLKKLYLLGIQPEFVEALILFTNLKHQLLNLKVNRSKHQPYPCMELNLRSKYKTRDQLYSFDQGFTCCILNDMKNSFKFYLPLVLQPSVLLYIGNTLVEKIEGMEDISISPS